MLIRTRPMDHGPGALVGYPPFGHCECVQEVKSLENRSASLNEARVFTALHIGLQLRASAPWKRLELWRSGRKSF